MGRLTFMPIVLLVAAVYDPAVLVGAVPNLGSEGASALATLDFAGELGNKGVEHYVRHMGSDPKLIHAFPVLRPDLPESERVIDEIIQWFREHE